MTTLRSAGYTEDALYLAKKHAKHDWYFKLQLEDMQNYEEAIEYTFSLPFEDARYAAQTYGKVLLEYFPERFTELVKALCTEYTPAAPVKAAQLQVRTAIISLLCCSRVETHAGFARGTTDIRGQQQQVVQSTGLHSLLRG